MLGFTIENSNPLNILCLGAHCDDIEIGCGGTLLKIFENYQIEKVFWIVFASNDIRKTEAFDSASRFLDGFENKEIIVKSFKDGFLPYNAKDIKEYFEVIKSKFSPDLIFTHFRDDRHQDHRLISDLTWNTWRNHLILEYEIPKYDGDLGVPSFYVPLERSHLRKKNQILLESFVSQNNKHWFDEDVFCALPRIRGIECASMFAEAFYVRKILF